MHQASSGPIFAEIKSRIGRFFAPRTIEPGQETELSIELAPGEKPWSPGHVAFPKHLKDKGFVILDLLIGRQSQTHSDHPIPMEAFLEGGDGICMGCDPITTKTPLKIQVRNDGAQAEMVYGFVSGTDVADGDSGQRPSPLPFPLEAAREHEEIFQAPGSPPDLWWTGDTLIAPGETRMLRASPQVTFRAHKLVVDVEAMPHFEIVDVLVSRVVGRQFDKPIPASEFVDNKNALDLDPVMPGMYLVLKVKNTSQRPQPFSARLKGLALDMRKMHVMAGATNKAYPMMPPAQTSEYAQNYRAPHNPPNSYWSGADEIAPGETRAISALPYLMFKPKRLLVDKESQPFFEVVDVRVGLDSCWPTEKPEPAHKFDGGPNSVLRDCEVVSPGIMLTLKVKNVDTVPHRFGASITGIAIQ